MKIQYVYCAGALTPRGDNGEHPAIEYLQNVNRLIRLAVDVLQAGFAPFCPALDFQYFLALREDETISEDRIKGMSIDWLEKCDAVILAEGWEKSPGTQKEVERAIELGIPICLTIEELRGTE